MVVSEQMCAQIKAVYLSSDFQEVDQIETTTEATDVIVQFKNGEKYVASFFSYQYVENWREKNQNAKELLNGKYFWVPNMVIVDQCTKENILQIVQFLIDEGDFKMVFKAISNH